MKIPTSRSARARSSSSVKQACRLCRRLFTDGYYAPDLVIFFMMGNATERWASEPGAALQDVRALIADLPPDQPCIFMTSAPPYKEKAVKERQQAQDNIEAAFTKAGKQCTFVPGLTPQTIAENQGNAANFRRNGSGKVKDPYHPTEAGARRFLKLQRGALCAAISRELVDHKAPNITSAREC